MLAWHVTVHAAVSKVSDDTGGAGGGAGTSPPDRGPRIQAVPLSFIHDVVGRSQAPSTSSAARAKFGAAGIRIFDSYVTPAVHCWRAGLLSDGALARVMTGARSDAGRVAYASGAQRRARHEELEAACDAAARPPAPAAAAAAVPAAAAAATGRASHVAGPATPVAAAAEGVGRRDAAGVLNSPEHELLRSRPWV
jgi:hypothetical protein